MTMPAAAITPAERSTPQLGVVPIADIDPNTWNPRQHSDAVAQAELEASIREKGVLQPLLLRWKGRNRYEVVAGMRRFTAAKVIGLLEVPALIKTLDDLAALEEAVSENIQRKDMHVVDEARAYAALQKADKRIYTVGKIASRFGQTESHVIRRLKLLELEKPLMEALSEDRLSIGHAERLCRLTPALRKKAADPENGVVWRHNPLLVYSEKWIPAREDLRPLNELEDFIRTKSYFDPTAPETLAFQPHLAEQIEAAKEETDQLVTGARDDEGDEVAGEALSTLVELSDDPMARSRLGVSKTAKIPLTPSRWREIKKPSDRCGFEARGVITHGKTAGRVLEVCTAKTKCTKHFPPAKKTKARGHDASTHKAEERRRAADQKQREEREATEKAWNDLKPHAFKAFAEHVAKVKFSAALVRTVLERYQLDNVERMYSVKLTDKTAAQVLALATATNDHNRDYFLRQVKPFGFNLGHVEQRLKADAKKAAAKSLKKTA